MQYRPGKCLLRYCGTKKKPFQAIKIRTSKSQKIDIFSKGLTHGFDPKMAVFPTFFLGNIGQENVFYDIVHPKNAFVAYKKKSSKSGKTSKGLTNSFGSKLAIFPNFFFRHYRLGKRSFTIFQNKKTPLQAIKTKSSKNRKIDIFLKGLVNHWFWCKNGPFWNFFFLGNTGQENIFYDILHLTNAFVAYKSKNIKKSKN